MTEQEIFHNYYNGNKESIISSLLDGTMSLKSSLALLPWVINDVGAREKGGRLYLSVDDHANADTESLQIYFLILRLENNSTEAIDVYREMESAERINSMH